jgi:DNA-binding NtrC family response regulator
MSGPKVMIVDDEEGFAVALSRALKGAGCEVHVFTDPDRALAALPQLDLDVLLSDIRMPGVSGVDLLLAVKRQRPELEVVMVTAYATVETAVATLKSGAYDYLTKPVEDLNEVIRLVQRAAERKRLVSRNRELERQLEAREVFSGMVGDSPAMHEVFRLIDAVARSGSTVLIEGESGTGKELAARAIHDRSPRRMAPFVAVNCGALPEPVLESELFGHVKGAFTGAFANKRGLFEAASGGTLFLDEIGEMPQAMQVKLLRALQEGEVKPVGATGAVQVDVRTIAATNVDLKAAVKKGSFREDLYYRVNVIGVRLPPLRERIEDLPLLAFHLLRKHADHAGKKVERISPETLQALSLWPWKGNIRELENVIERAVVLTAGRSIELADLPAELRSRDVGKPSSTPEPLGKLPYARARVVAMRNFERRYLEELLAANRGNVSSAARAAGMDRSNFRRILKKHKLEVPDQE